MLVLRSLYRSRAAHVRHASEVSHAATCFRFSPPSTAMATHTGSHTPTVKTERSKCRTWLGRWPFTKTAVVLLRLSTRQPWRMALATSWSRSGIGVLFQGIRVSSDASVTLCPRTDAQLVPKSGAVASHARGVTLRASASFDVSIEVGEINSAQPLGCLLLGGNLHAAVLLGHAVLLWRLVWRLVSLPQRLTANALGQGLLRARQWRAPTVVQITWV